jgi:hypothetical protein
VVKLVQFELVLFSFVYDTWFLVFLVAIQRFSLADWGFDLELDPLACKHHFPHNSELAPSNLETTESKINNNPAVIFSSKMDTLLHDPFCLKGKSMYISSMNRSTEQLQFVAKLYWPNCTQLNKANIIKLAWGSAPELQNHLPNVFQTLLDFGILTLPVPFVSEKN